MSPAGMAGVNEFGSVNSACRHRREGPHEAVVFLILFEAFRAPAVVPTEKSLFREKMGPSEDRGLLEIRDWHLRFQDFNPPLRISMAVDSPAHI